MYSTKYFLNGVFCHIAGQILRKQCRWKVEMDPVGNGFPGAAGGALGRILQSKGGVLSTSLACRVGEISLHITCFTSPAYRLGSVSSASAPASQSLFKKRPPHYFDCLLLFFSSPPLFLLLLRLIFFP